MPFIDIHTHAEGILECPRGQNFLRQGVTTVISGNCGGGTADVRGFLRQARAARPSINVGMLIGHSEVRRQVLGQAPRVPTRRELAAMRRLVEQGMQAGAFGLSSGLIYIPGVYARTPELISLARVAAEPARGGPRREGAAGPLRTGGAATLPRTDPGHGDPRAVRPVDGAEHPPVGPSRTGTERRGLRVAR